MNRIIYLLKTLKNNGREKRRRDKTEVKTDRGTDRNSRDREGERYIKIDK